MYYEKDKGGWPVYKQSDESDKKYWKSKRPCISPYHKFPSMLVIPPGQSFTHTCPSCGATQTVHSPIIY